MFGIAEVFTTLVMLILINYAIWIPSAITVLLVGAALWKPGWIWRFDRLLLAVAFSLLVWITYWIWVG